MRNRILRFREVICNVLKHKRLSVSEFNYDDLFENIFDEYSDRVYKIAYKFVNNPDEASDIVQDTFLKIYRNIEYFKNVNRERTISLIVIYAKNASLDLLRKKSRKNKHFSSTYSDDDEVENDELPDDTDTPEEIIINRDIGERLAKYINMLPDSQREVIMLKYYHEMKEKEIAEILNITESTVSTRLSRAKEKLRELIGGSEDEEDFRNR